MSNCKHGMDSRFCATCADRADPSGETDRRREGVRLRAAGRRPTTEAEREAYEAVYAYEEARSKQKGKTIRASRTWPMVDEHGIIAAVERIVMRPDDAAGYRVLVAMGLEEMAFEAVVLRHSDVFSPEAVDHSRRRLERLHAERPPSS